MVLDGYNSETERAHKSADPNAKAFGSLPFVVLARNRRTQAGEPLGRRVGVESTY